MYKKHIIVRDYFSAHTFIKYENLCTQQHFMQKIESFEIVELN